VYGKSSLLPGKNPRHPPVHRKLSNVFPFADACIPPGSKEPDPRTSGESFIKNRHYTAQLLKIKIKVFARPKELEVIQREEGSQLNRGWELERGIEEFPK
jgi:hypothetical protein